MPHIIINSCVYSVCVLRNAVWVWEWVVDFYRKRIERNIPKGISYLKEKYVPLNDKDNE